jgi:hypothetical protein
MRTDMVQIYMFNGERIVRLWAMRWQARWIAKWLANAL